MPGWVDWWKAPSLPNQSGIAGGGGGVALTYTFAYRPTRLG